MAMMVTTRLLRRGLELFAGISALGFVGLLLYGNNLSLFLQAMVSLRWEWALLGVGSAPTPFLAVSVSVSLLLLISGAFVFRRMEREFADVV